jgi:cytidyltransferase-like protein
MKFNKVLCNNVLKEWRFYAVDYKAMKQTLKPSNDGKPVESEEFFRLFELSKQTLQKFYSEKETWAMRYFQTMEEKVEELKQNKVSSRPKSQAGEGETNAVTDTESVNSSLASGTESEEEPDMVVDLGSMRFSGSTSSSFQISKYDARGRTEDNSAWLKEEYRRVGKSKHFHDFIYAKKSLDTFSRELDLLLEFLDLNQTAFSKILKKFDKRSGSSIREAKLEELSMSHSFLNGEKFRELQNGVSNLLKEVKAHKPSLPDGWGERKVYTIGCFDLFHRGHQNVLMSLREFGYFIVAGIHCDESYFKLKNKYTIDNLETRMKNVKPFVDQMYVIPSTDPNLYLKSMVSEQDIMAGSCCYARGDDMLKFPGREWVESVMPVHFVPRTESCSSTLIRTIYHADDPELRKKAAFAATRYDGKPVDESGNVLKL